MKRLLFILVALTMLLTACQTAPAEVAPEPINPYTAEEQNQEPINILEHTDEEQMTWTDRINLIYEWLAIYDEEHRMSYDFTYDVRRPFYELTDNERAAQSMFRIFYTTFHADVLYSDNWHDNWEEAMRARGFINAGYNFYIPLIENAPNPGILSQGIGFDYWIFPNWYAAFLFAGGYEAGFETLWEEDVHDEFLREMGRGFFPLEETNKSK